MKKLIVVFLVVIVAVGGGFLVGNYLKNNNKGTEHSKSTEAYQLEKGLVWGISVNAYPTGPHNPETLERVTQEVESLGVGMVRYTFPSWSKPDPFTFTDTVMEKWKGRDFGVVLAFQPNVEYTDMKDPYKEGYDQANKLAQRYPDIKYFQMGNEPGNSALKPSWSGSTADSYDDKKYAAVSSWLEGASNGVSAANKSAEKIITGNWLGAAFFEKLVSDNIKFDIIGWDWFEEKDNDIIATKADGDQMPILDRLDKIGKDIWLTESGLGGENEKEQASYLQSLVQSAQDKKFIKAIFVGVFFDQAHLVGTTGELDGIYSIKKNADGTFSFGSSKPAYDVFKKIISDSK